MVSSDGNCARFDRPIGAFPRGVQAFFDRFPDGKFENLKVVVAGDVGTFEWDFVTTDPDSHKVRTAGCDLLRFVGDKVATKNAFRKVRG
jgi:beta-alanine degradation protein BauB